MTGSFALHHCLEFVVIVELHFEDVVGTGLHTLTAAIAFIRIDGDVELPSGVAVSVVGFNRLFSSGGVWIAFGQCLARRSRLLKRR